MGRGNSPRYFAGLAGICLMAVATIPSRASSPGHSIGGYAEDYVLVAFPPGNRSNARVDNLFQCRLNTQWYPWPPLIVEAAGRLLWYGGKDFEQGGAIATGLSDDPGYLDLSWAQGSDGTPLVLFENIDRLDVSLTLGNFSATIGRDRINWGTCLVWNPNDWFNAFNYLDFAYPEHSGVDALWLQWYPGPTSIVQLAAQAGRTQKERTFAMLYKMNKWSYDWQLQAGLSGRDMATGFSWSGAIRGAGFRGEVSWYVPAIDRDISRKQHLVASIGADYTFANSLYLHGAALYNGFGAFHGGFIAPAAMSRVTAKSLIPERYALFGEIAYQLTPLVRIDFSSSVSPTDGSLYLSPLVTLSALDNLDILGLAQVFLGSAGDLYGDSPDIITVNLHWSF